MIPPALPPSTPRPLVAMRRSSRCSWSAAPTLCCGRSEHKHLLHAVEAGGTPSSLYWQNTSPTTRPCRSCRVWWITSRRRSRRRFVFDRCSRRRASGQRKSLRRAHRRRRPRLPSQTLLPRTRAPRRTPGGGHRLAAPRTLDDDRRPSAEENRSTTRRRAREAPRGQADD